MITRRVLTALTLAGCLLTFLAVDAEARARGGGFRGSRTHSSPAPRPEAPAPPARHHEALRSGRDAGDAARLMGGMGGFVAGGLLFRMLAGHGIGHAGVGLPDLLLLGMAGLAAYWLLRVRAQFYGAAGSGTMSQAAYLAALPALAAVGAGPRDVGSVVVPRTSLRGALDTAAFATSAQQAFVAVHHALALGDVTLVCDRLIPATLATLQDRCRGAEPGERRVVEPPEVEVLDAWRDRDHEHVHARFIGPEDRWTFRRPIGATRWKVVALEGAAAA